MKGNSFSELGDLRSELEATTIRCIVLRKENPKRLIREIFSRLNQGAVKLSDQEIRHALYPGSLDKILSELADINEIKNFGIGLGGEKKKDSREGEEQVLRFFAFRERSDDYKNNLKEFLDDYMEKNSELSDDEATKKKKEFFDSLNKCKIVFGDELFVDMNKARRRQGMVYYDLLMQTLGQIDNGKLTAHKNEIVHAYKELCSSPDFKKTTSGGLQMKASISRRTDLWNKLLHKALDDAD